MNRSQSEGSFSRSRPRAANGAPDLNGALETEGWRKAIKVENATSRRLTYMLEMNKIKAREAMERQRRQISMPMPPTTMSLAMSRLNRPATREIAMRRSMTRTNTMPSELFSTASPWASQVAITPYAPLIVRPSRGYMRPEFATLPRIHAPESLPAPWR